MRQETGDRKAEAERQGDLRLASGNWKGEFFVILRNGMTKNLGQNQISAGGQTFRFDRYAQDDRGIKSVNGELEEQPKGEDCTTDKET